ncbi:MAG: rubrerythrin family protein [Nitrospirae bacterium]|nr:rubrerythrin family protein [Nitrospirota bacterium]
MELVNVNKLGISKGTAIEDAVTANFKGETGEVGLYLAMARQAQTEGYPEIAETLKRIAWEEADHAARYAELNGLISENTKENLEKMLNGEIGANKGKREAAVKAKEVNVDEAHDFFDESSRDEARHAMMLNGLLNRFFPAKGGSASDGK